MSPDQTTLGLTLHVFLFYIHSIKSSSMLCFQVKMDEEGDVSGQKHLAQRVMRMGAQGGCVLVVTHACNMCSYYIESRTLLSKTSKSCPKPPLSLPLSVSIVRRGLTYLSQYTYTPSLIYILCLCDTH